MFGQRALLVGVTAPSGEPPSAKIETRGASAEMLGGQQRNAADCAHSKVLIVERKIEPGLCGMGNGAPFRCWIVKQQSDSNR